MTSREGWVFDIHILKGKERQQEFGTRSPFEVGRCGQDVYSMAIYVHVCARENRRWRVDAAATLAASRSHGVTESRTRGKRAQTGRSSCTRDGRAAVTEKSARRVPPGTPYNNNNERKIKKRTELSSLKREEDENNKTYTHTHIERAIMQGCASGELSSVTKKSQQRYSERPGEIRVRENQKSAHRIISLRVQINSEKSINETEPWKNQFLLFSFRLKWEISRIISDLKPANNLYNCTIREWGRRGTLRQVVYFFQDPLSYFW